MRYCPSDIGGPQKEGLELSVLRRSSARKSLPHQGKIEDLDYTAFAMNPKGQVVGGQGHRVRVEAIDQLLEQAGETDDAATFVEVHERSCSLYNDK